MAAARRYHDAWEKLGREPISSSSRGTSALVCIPDSSRRLRYFRKAPLCDVGVFGLTARDPPDFKQAADLATEDGQKEILRSLVAA
jgi:hypothetical protein